MVACDLSNESWFHLSLFLADSLRIDHSILIRRCLWNFEGNFVHLIGIPRHLCWFPWCSYSFTWNRTTRVIFVDCSWSHIHARGLAMVYNKILALSFLSSGKILHVDNISVPVFSSDNGFLFSWDLWVIDCGLWHSFIHLLVVLWHSSFIHEHNL